MEQKINKWKENDDDSTIVIKAKKHRKTIKELFEKYDGPTKLEEVDFGEPEGKEAW